MDTKRCTKCCEIKEIDLFPKGRNECKKCRSNFVLVHYRLHRDEICQSRKAYEKEYDRKRNKDPERAEYARQLYWKNRDKILESRKGKIVQQKPRDPLKEKCKALFAYAVKNGRIQKGCCSICGEQKVEGHHFDYSKPYEVVWLCHRHHAELRRIK